MYFILLKFAIHSDHIHVMYMTAGFCHDVDMSVALLVYYTVWSGNS